LYEPVTVGHGLEATELRFDIVNLGAVPRKSNPTGRTVRELAVSPCKNKKWVLDLDDLRHPRGGYHPCMVRFARAQFDPDLHILRDVRRFVGAKLRDWNLTPLIDDAVLVTSELAANAVTHARSAFTVGLRASRRSLTVEVGDESTQEPSLAPVTPGALNGRGLQITQALSRAWGVRHIPDDGKVVWAELPNSHPAGSPTPPASR
jgi:hypothetical protein